MIVTFRAAARSSAARRSPRSISRRVARATVNGLPRYLPLTPYAGDGPNHHDPVTTSHLTGSDAGSIDHMVREEFMMSNHVTAALLGRVTP